MKNENILSSVTEYTFRSCILVIISICVCVCLYSLKRKMNHQEYYIHDKI